MKKKNFTFYTCLCLLLVWGCHDSYLDLKSDQGRVTPSKLNDFEKMIDHDAVLNSYSLHFLMNISADDFYLTEKDWSQLSANYERNGYVWLKDIFGGDQSSGWNRAYQKVLYTNVILEGLNSVTQNANNLDLWNNIYGSALFFRGWTFYQLAQVFCEDYAEENLSKPGIPLKLTSDINEKLSRATIGETYKQMISDLKTAAEVLPTRQRTYNRPAKAIAHAVLAKVYLQMEDYELSLLHSENYLKDFSMLIDFNDLDVDLKYPFPMEGKANHEIVYFEYDSPTVILGYDRVKVDTLLYNMYEDNDLRKSAFFYEKEGNQMYGGSYTGFDFLTGTPTTNEVYLIAAENHARLGDKRQSLHYLNNLLEKRYRKGTFAHLDYASTDELLERVLVERRKELLFKGTRWSDLRRFRKSKLFGQELTRKLNGKEYKLTIGSPNWVWPIPENAINLGEYEQNIRE